jgi:hypothetical protein
MIQVRLLGAARIVVDDDHFLGDVVLHDLGRVSAPDMNAIPAAGAGLNDWVPFRVTLGTIGRRHKQALTGPTNFSSTAEDHLVSYEIKIRRTNSRIPGEVLPPSQSAPTAVKLPAFSLETPTKGGADNLTISFQGSVETSNAQAADQTNEVRLYDKDRFLTPALRIGNVLQHQTNLIGKDVKHRRALPKRFPALLRPRRLG